MKHPTLSPERIEELQRWCFDQDFHRLGPSIFRVLETRLLGYRQLKDSHNPVLRARAAYYEQELRCATAVFLAGRLFGPNAAVRRWIGDLENELLAEFGRPPFIERLKSILGVGAAAWTWFTLKFDLFQHPKLLRTPYRMPAGQTSDRHLWEQIPHKLPDLAIQVELTHARQEVHLRVSGPLPAAGAVSLAHRVHESLARSRDRLVLDLENLHWDQVGDLAPLREKLAAYRSRVQVVLPKLQAAHPELILLAGMFARYQGG